MTAAASSTRARPHGNLDPWAGRLGDPEGHASAARKLVIDQYGPQAPLGGGAICGKDVHKPGLEGPDRLSARLADGRWLDADAIAGLVSVPDLTLAGTASDLELASVDWPTVMRRGYFGTGERWEG